MTASNWVSAVASPENQIALASMLLGAVGLLVAVAAIFGYLNVKRNAAKVAAAEAHKLALQIAEQAANAYLQKELPDIVSQYMDLAKDYVNSDEAARMAEGQDNEENEE